MNNYFKTFRVSFGVAAIAVAGSVAIASAQTAPPPAPVPNGGSAANATTSPDATTAGAPPAAGAAASPALPPDYVIGPDDVLSVSYWKDKDMSADKIAVRPDGKISLPLINDIQAAGLTPDQLRENVVKAAGKYQDDPQVTVVVNQINSRKVFITGEVAKQGAYPLNEPTTVMQLIVKAGGLNEYAKGRIRIIRAERRPDGQPWTLEVNYKDILNGKSLKQVSESLKPGDTIIVR